MMPLYPTLATNLRVVFKLRLLIITTLTYDESNLNVHLVMLNDILNLN